MSSIALRQNPMLPLRRKNEVDHRHHHGSSKLNYFTEFTFKKAVLYICASIYVGCTAVVAMMEPLMTMECHDPGEKLKFQNPVYDGTHCRHVRYPQLLFLCREECMFGRRLVLSVMMGGLIGWERREADRPAGIRTMSLVSLGSCLFTINSAFAFLDGPMNWDASRVAAAIPSGVGFLGAGLIFKKEQQTGEGGTAHVVHGLTTAASLWLSAAVGIACGGGLYFAASYGVAVMMLLLRFGPRSADNTEEDDDDEDIEREEEGDEPCPLETELAALTSMDAMTNSASRVSYGGISGPGGDSSVLSEGAASQRSKTRSSRASVRKRQQAALASEV